MAFCSVLSHSDRSQTGQPRENLARMWWYPGSRCHFRRTLPNHLRRLQPYDAYSCARCRGCLLRIFRWGRISARAQECVRSNERIHDEAPPSYILLFRHEPLENLIHVPRRGLLSLRKLLERLRELRDVGGRLAKEEDVAAVPVPVGVVGRFSTRSDAPD